MTFTEIIETFIDRYSLKGYNIIEIYFTAWMSLYLMSRINRDKIIVSRTKFPQNKTRKIHEMTKDIVYLKVYLMEPRHPVQSIT